MKTSNRILRGIVCGGLTLALAGGVALPITACAASNDHSTSAEKLTEHHKEIQSMREKMLAQAKAEDAALEKLVAELNKAPESKKVDLEAAILNKLVAQHHQRLAEWESFHAHVAQAQK